MLELDALLSTSISLLPSLLAGWWRDLWGQPGVEPSRELRPSWRGMTPRSPTLDIRMRGVDEPLLSSEFLLEPTTNKSTAGLSQ